MHTVQPITPQPKTTEVQVEATSNADFDNPVPGTVVVQPSTPLPLDYTT